jgi:hypothetical protein
MSFDLKIVKGDIFIERDGSIKTVFGNEKLRQDIVKILLTKIDENKYHSSYGSNLGIIQVGNVQDETFLKQDLANSAQDAIKTLMSLQRVQAKSQYLSPSETIVDIKSIDIKRDTIDPRMYNIFISVLTQELDSITESITIRIV